MSCGDSSVRNKSNRHESESDEDVWDDRALISAYDRATSKVNEALAGKRHSGGKHASVTNSNVLEKKNKDKSVSSRRECDGEDEVLVKSKWNVGDSCRCVFSEDEVEYEAHITSIDIINNTCIVEYIGYGNEEEKSLEELKETQLGTLNLTHGQVDLNEQEESELAKSNIHLNANPNHRKGSLKKRTAHFNEATPHWLVNNSNHKTPSSVNHGAANRQHNHMPHSSMPPLIPPFMPDSSLPSTSEEEALASMLMSWYMSGYHTGYYKAMKQSKHNCNCKH